MLRAPEFFSGGAEGTAAKKAENEIPQNGISSALNASGP